MFRDILYMPRNLLRNIMNVITWLPVVWADRQWDHVYLIKIIGKKLELMEKHMRSENCMASVNQDKYIKQVQTCKNLCKRITSHNYLDNALTQHHKIYGNEIKWSFEPVEGKPKFFTLNFNKTPAESKSFSRAGKHADMMEDQDYKMLFSIMNKYIQRWWD